MFNETSIDLSHSAIHLLSMRMTQNKWKYPDVSVSRSKIYARRTEVKDLKSKRLLIKWSDRSNYCWYACFCDKLKRCFWRSPLPLEWRMILSLILFRLTTKYDFDLPLHFSMTFLTCTHVFTAYIASYVITFCTCNVRIFLKLEKFQLLCKFCLDLKT